MIPRLRAPSRALWAATLLASVALFAAAPASASIPNGQPSFPHDSTTLPFLPSLAESLPAEAPPSEPNPFIGDEETRVGGFDFVLRCSVGGDAGLTCGSRLGYEVAYGGTASDRLLYAKARYFDPELGRFLTQDSFLGQIDNPPSLHRYFYANDNPMRYVDPTGHANEGANAVSDETIRQWVVHGQESGLLPPDYGEPNTAPTPVVVEEPRSAFGRARDWVAEKWNGYTAWTAEQARRMGGATGGLLGSLFTRTSTEGEEGPSEHKRAQVAGMSDYEKGILYHTEKTFKDTDNASSEVAGKVVEKGTELGIAAVETELGVRVLGVGGVVARELGSEARLLRAEGRTAEEMLGASRAQSSRSTATQIGTRRLPNAENPWIKYQKHATGRSYEEMWRLNANKVGVDASRSGYTVEAKWAGKNDVAWRRSPYNPRSEFYDEKAILDQAQNLIELNKASGGSGVRYAVSNDAARVHFDALFRQQFPGENIQVLHVPGTGMK